MSTNGGTIRCFSNELKTICKWKRLHRDCNVEHVQNTQYFDTQCMHTHQTHIYHGKNGGTM